MASITLTFSNDINVSAQVGDVAYYVPTATSSSFTINSSSIVTIGVITVVDDVLNQITCNTNLTSSSWPSVSDFILFSKDNKANMSSLLGYYAELTIRNNSQSKAEIFQINADYFDSSK